MAEQPTIEQQLLAEARVEVGFADQKASLILAAVGVGFGALAAALLARDWKPSELSGCGEVIWWVGATLALASVFAAGFSVWPRFSAKDVDEGIYYWGHVAHYRSLATFTKAFNDSKPKREDRTLHQLWHLSRIVKKKHWGVRVSLGCAIGAVLAFLMASLIGG